MSAPPPFLLALRQPPRAGAGTDGVTVKHIGELVAPTGRLMACDGLIIEPAATLATTLPPGRYPIFLGCIDGRTAWAMLVASDQPVVSWRPDKELEGIALGYGVDSGAGCFIDAQAAEVHEHAEEALSAAIGAELTRRGVTTSDPSVWHDAFEAVRVSLTGKEPQLHERIQAAGLDARGFSSVLVDAESEANVIAFKSGEGDGVYATWVGLDRRGQVARMVTDFQLLAREPGRADDTEVGR